MVRVRPRRNGRIHPAFRALQAAAVRVLPAAARRYPTGRGTYPGDLSGGSARLGALRGNSALPNLVVRDRFSRILRAHRRKAAFRAMFSGSAPADREAAARDHLDRDMLLRDAVGKTGSDGSRNPHAAGIRSVELRGNCHAPSLAGEHRAFAVVPRADQAARPALGARSCLARFCRLATDPIGGTRMTATTQHIAPEDIMALLDGELAAAEARAVAEHMETCVECAAQSRSSSARPSRALGRLGGSGACPRSPRNGDPGEVGEKDGLASSGEELPPAYGYILERVGCMGSGRLAADASCRRSPLFAMFHVADGLFRRNRPMWPPEATRGSGRVRDGKAACCAPGGWPIGEHPGPGLRLRGERKYGRPGAVGFSAGHRENIGKWLPD